MVFYGRFEHLARMIGLDDDFQRHERRYPWMQCAEQQQGMRTKNGVRCTGRRITIVPMDFIEGLLVV